MSTHLFKPRPGGVFHVWDLHDFPLLRFQSGTQDVQALRPLGGGHLQFYERGTTTPKLTWSDREKSVPNPNLVPLDSAGRITPPWRNYLARLSLTQDSDTLRALYETLDKTVAQIQNGQSLRLSILSRQSIDVDGVVSNGVAVLALVGDEATPTAEAYYGTDATGAQGRGLSQRHSCHGCF
ncbi:hypothetical protein FUT69_10255 [Xylella taiwanensis]|uniref:Uncharacterized protein n=1 Tax=Xylella taiwanensis TaxID=1444770 RepID=Z9JKG7_9GAMM|nr:hypothetical protein [Xylella taiwanensis]AXI82903.1 hypothetical protein AB672_02500 [Xylella taiwanensis]EWS78468.1 hypothetical protein AF72_05170 [Xylella taiwanensis]MCD8455919.1 hypothetical protein [Xylella taiwanensis]MCD8458322.1 hypothetical protein [Xylella taiwanensis]MCD8460461.1 hypothetical protein [Xylella taiwanensis]